MSQDRIDYQRKIEDGMFSRNIRADILDEFDLEDLLADQIYNKLPDWSNLDETDERSWENYLSDEKNHILISSKKLEHWTDEEGKKRTKVVDKIGELDLKAMKKAFKHQSHTVDLNDLLVMNQLLDDVPEDEFDIDELKDEFKKLTSEIALEVRRALELASGEKNLKADTTWNPLLTYDRAGTCPNCGELFPLNQRISNNKPFLMKVNKMFTNARETLPIKWQKENRGKKLFFWSDVERTVFEQGEMKKVKLLNMDWELFRSALESSDVNFEQKTGRMKRKEMLSLNEVDSVWGKIAAGLILCDKRSLTCPHKTCQENLWPLNLDSHSPFHKISYEATRVILEETVSSPTARAPLSMTGYSGNQPISLKMGKIGDDYSRDSKKLIAEAVLSATTVLGDISIKTDSDLSYNEVALDGINISQSDSEKAAKVYTTPSHSIVTKLAKVIERIRPVEAFVLDDRDIGGHKQWAAMCAGQILHAINHAGILFKVEKTGSWTYSSGKTSEHATNLITLNENIQSKITSEKFVKPSNDGEIIYNQLESMLSKETTPPMVCEPTSRTLDDEAPGGMRTKAGQRMYPLVTQSPQYKRFKANRSSEIGEDIFRFTPSEDAVSSINNLQSTEWAVNREMVELARETIINHVKNEIKSNLKIRKAWQIRRHYFEDSEGQPIIMSNGEAKTYPVMVDGSRAEFESLDEAESYMSSQDTSSETCSKEKQNRMKYDHWNEQIHEVLYIDFDGLKPSVTFGQVNAWWNTFDFIERLEKNYPDTKFWHAWHFDWRGRIMPISTMLSPQNDDFSRGLITFANPEPLTDNGRKWVGRVIAGMYNKRPIPEEFKGDQKEILLELMAKLKSKTFEAYDEVSSHELFQEMMRVIAKDPMKNFVSWGKDDVFRAKAEGLQRIALTKEFVSILEQGENASMSLPINLDASSSIYQHASALMLDSSMASKVNVLPNSSDKPSDVYLEVVNHLGGVWTGNPFKNFELNRSFLDSGGKQKKVTHLVEGIDDKTAELLKAEVLTRSMAKKPVMTIGYGASTQSMVAALLTDNQEDNGKIGGVIPYHLGENWPTVIPFEDVDQHEERDYRWLVTAHPSSTLGRICNKLKIPNHFHWLIAQEVISGFRKSIEEVLPGYKEMKKSVSKLCSENLEMQFNTSAECKVKWEQFCTSEENQGIDEKDLKKQFMKSKEFLKICGGLTWTVQDGCKIRNIYYKDPVMKSMVAWGGMDNATKTIRTIAKDALPEESKDLISFDNLTPIDFEALSEVKGFDEEIYLRLKIHENDKVNKVFSAIHESDYSTEAINVESLVIDWPTLAKELGVGTNADDIIKHDTGEQKSSLSKIISTVRKYSGNFNVTFSRTIMSDDRDLSGERTGIAPNFIHSLDACHMRLVVSAMARNGITDIWSVHDAFGCHPNHIEDLRFIINKQFVNVHQADENGRGVLARLYYEITGKELKAGDMDLSEIARLIDGELLSKYLVS